MDKCIMVGCDMHDKQIVVKVAEGRGPTETWVVRNDTEGRAKLLGRLRTWAEKGGGARVVMAY